MIICCSSYYLAFTTHTFLNSTMYHLKASTKFRKACQRVHNLMEQDAEAQQPEVMVIYFPIGLNLKAFLIISSLVNINFVNFLLRVHCSFIALLRARSEMRLSSFELKVMGKSDINVIQLAR